MVEKTVSEAINYRRSVRVYKDEKIDTDQVKNCLINASLAPTSSNMQLWEFYHISNKNTINELSVACFDQNAAKTAQQLVVFVTRKDLWRQRAKSNVDFIHASFDKPEMAKFEKRKKMALSYYQKLIPTLYFDFLGIVGLIKFAIFQVVGLFRPIYRQTRTSDMRVVAHKSTGLAAENFMVSMAAIGYDTCPMEGYDSLRVKKILKLSRNSEINMIVSCGLRDENGVYGDRFRVPFEEVYFSDHE
jgi:nitroreductase